MNTQTLKAIAIAICLSGCEHPVPATAYPPTANPLDAVRACAYEGVHEVPNPFGSGLFGAVLVYDQRQAVYHRCLLDHGWRS